MVHKTKETKTQHNTRCTSLSGKTHKQRKEDGRPVQTTGGKYEPNIVLYAEIITQRTTWNSKHNDTYQ